MFEKMTLNELKELKYKTCRKPDGFLLVPEKGKADYSSFHIVYIKNMKVVGKGKRTYKFFEVDDNINITFLNNSGCLYLFPSLMAYKEIKTIKMYVDPFITNTICFKGKK